MLNTQYVTLSMIPSGVMPVLYCSQYDVGRPLGFVVNNGSEVVNLDQYMVAIEGTRSDGTGIVADVNTDGNIGVFLTTATMTNKSDIYDMQLVIRSTDTHRVASIPFMMNVRTAALDENSSVIEEDKSLFQQYTETVMIALAEIRTDVESEATARSNADSALLEKINIEAADRAAEDNALNDRIDNIIAPGGAPSAAEVTDARFGADGVLYDTLGEAIRTQFDDVYKNLAYTVNLESNMTGLLVVNGGIGGTVPTALTATLEPQQTGSGAPSADNIRPFVQFTSLSMLHAGESGGGGSGNPPVTPFFGGTQNCITGEWTLYQYNSNYDGVGDMTGVRWWSDRDVYVPGTNPSVGAYVVYEPTTPMRSSGQAWGAEAMFPGINQYKMLAYDSVTHTTAPFALTIETDVANVGDVVDGIAHDVSTLQSDMDQTNQALTLLRNEYDVTASTVVTHTTLIENNTEDIAENTADIAENAHEISLVKSHLEEIADTVYGKNRWNVSVYEQGYLGSDGSIIASDSWRTTDYCYVKGFSNIIASVKNASNYTVGLSMFYLCTYGEGKQFIERKWTIGDSTASLDSNVVYVRFSYNAFASTNNQLEEGTTITSYEPYHVEEIIKTDTTMTSEKLPANAKAVGDAFANHINDGVISYIETPLTMISNKLINGLTGVITDSDSTSYKVSNPVDIEGCRKIAVTTEHHWQQGMVVFFDSNGDYISGIRANAGGTVTQFYFNIIDVPSNAKTVVIGFDYQSSFQEAFLFKGTTQDVTTNEIWKNKKWVCIGDSLTAYNTMTAVHYFDYVKARTGISVINMGVSGSGYAQLTDNFMTRVLNVPTDADVVTIFGSGNDASSGLPLGVASDTGTSTLGGVINTTIDNLYSIMPIINLGIITPTPWKGNMPSDNGWMENYANLIVDICKRRSIPCLDLFHCSNLNPNSSAVRAIAYSNDGDNGVHPDETGHRLIAPRFKEFLETLLL